MIHNETNNCQNNVSENHKNGACQLKTLKTKF